MRLLRTTSVVLATVLLVLGTAGCGAGDDRAGDLAGDPSPPPTPAPPPTLRPPSGPPSAPSDVFERTRLVGVVVEAPEGCTELVSDVGVRWSLLGPLVEGLEVGRSVVVVGRSRPEVPSSPCTGAPLVVALVEQT